MHTRFVGFVMSRPIFGLHSVQSLLFPNVLPYFHEKIFVAGGTTESTSERNIVPGARTQNYLAVNQ